MQKRHLALLLAAATLGGAVPHAAPAQEISAGQTQPVQAAALNGPTISIDFPGGSLGDYVEAIIKAAAPEPVNILVQNTGNGQPLDMPIEPITLRDVTVQSALSVLQSRNYHEGDRTSHAFVRTEQPAAGRAIHTVVVQTNESPLSSGRTGDSGPSDILVLPIKELTTPLPGDPPESVIPAEVVLTAIEAVLEVSGDDGATEVKYHAPSGLVMLSGPGASLRAAQDVLTQMSQDNMIRRDRARQLQKNQGLANPEEIESDLADAQAELELTTLRMHTAAQRREMSSKYFEEQKKLNESGFVSDGEMNALQMRVVETQAEMEATRIEMDRQRQRVEQLRRALERSRAIAAGGNPTDELGALRTENAMLRDRLAVMEAQLAELQSSLRSRSGGAGGRTGGGGR